MYEATPADTLMLARGAQGALLQPLAPPPRPQASAAAAGAAAAAAAAAGIR